MTNTPNNTPSFGPSSGSADVAMTGHAAASLVELLEHCEQFLRTASPVVRTELHAFLTDRPTRPDTDWLIDMLGFNALYLKGKLLLADNTDTDTHTDQTGDQA